VVRSTNTAVAKPEESFTKIKRELWERDENGDTFAMRLIKIANRLRLEKNPAADLQCPECGECVKQELLRSHLEECRPGNA
jgi:hypothetical protein